MILPSIQNFMRCVAKGSSGQRPVETALARKLLRRLVCGSRELQSGNVAFGKAVVGILSAIADIDPEKQWLFYEPSGKNKKTGCIELSIEYTGCREFHVRREALTSVAHLFEGARYEAAQKRRFLDLLFDSCGNFLFEIRKVHA